MKKLEISIEPKKYNKPNYEAFDYIGDAITHDELREYIKWYVKYTYQQYQCKFYKELMKKISFSELSIYRKVCEKIKETEKEITEKFDKHANTWYINFAKDFEN